MKVRITFEAGDCVEPEMIGRTFENSGPCDDTDKDCDVCAFNGCERLKGNPMNTACVQSCGCHSGAFVEVTDGQTKEVGE